MNERDCSAGEKDRAAALATRPFRLSRRYLRTTEMRSHTCSPASTSSTIAIA